MRNNKILGSILLVSGVTIGAGMLGLPIVTGLSGFFPSCLLFIIFWSIMLWTSYLLLELHSSIKSENLNLISMAKIIFNKYGYIFVWILYLLQLYALIVAYLNYGGILLINFLNYAINLQYNNNIGAILLLIIFGPFIYFGINFVDMINRYLMICLVLSFVIMIACIIYNIKLQNLLCINLNYSLVSVSIIITSFGFHIIIPSLYTYLDKNIKNVKYSLFYGTLIPLMIYLLWEFVVLGSVVFDANMVLDNTHNIANILYMKLQNPVIMIITNCFSIFAIITSFVGVGQSLLNFWQNELNLYNKQKKILLFLITFMPNVIILIICKTSFLLSLEYAGIFVSLLLGIVPICMIWRTRYILKLNSIYMVNCGKISLISGIIFFLFIIYATILNKL